VLISECFGTATNTNIFRLAVSESFVEDKIKADDGANLNLASSYIINGELHVSNSA
jgi:hypothetical protein